MTVSPMSQGMRSSHVSSYEHSVADRMDTADASARFASCFHEASSQQLAQDASQLLGMVRSSNTPQQNIALIDAAVQDMSGQDRARSCHQPQQQSQMPQALGTIAQQVAGAPEMSDATKNQILGEISQILSQLSQANGAGPSKSTGAGDGTQTQPGSQDGSQQSQLAETLGNIADQVAGASGLSDATKNQILGEIAHALSQLQQGGGQASDALSPTTKTAISTLSQDIESALSGNPSLAATINSELSQVLAGAVGAQ